MTIAIGLISKKSGRSPGIVMASDSQFTRESTKSLDSRKISVIEFLNAEVLVAQSRTADLSNKAIEIFSKKAKGRSIECADTPIKLAEESVREIRKHLIEVYQGCNFSDDGWRRYFKENNFDLMVGYYFERTPFLYHIDLDWCLPTRKDSCLGIGVGRDMGEFLLREYMLSEPEFEYAWVVAVSIVEKVSVNVNGCGGPTWAGIVYPLPGGNHRTEETHKQAVF